MILCNLWLEITCFFGFEKNYDVSLALSNLANLLEINLEIVQRISELRQNFLKHSQNSHFNYNDPALINSSTVQRIRVDLLHP